MKLYEVEEQFEKTKVEKDNYYVDPDNIMMNDDGSIELTSERQTYQLTDHSFNQLVSKIRSAAGLSASVMPTKYLKACPNYSRAYQINDWIRNSETEGKKWLLRVEPNRGRIKAVLSENYSIFDNKDLINSVKDVAGDIDFTDVWMTQDSLHLRYTDPATKVGEGRKEMKAGWHLRNDEIGTSSVAAGFLVYQLICSNGLMGFKEYDNIFRKRHVGDMNIAAELSQTIENFDKHKALDVLLNMLDSDNIKIEETPTVVFSAIQQNFPNITVEMLERAEHYLEDFQGGFTKFNLLTSLTQSARDLYSGDSRHTMERSLGKLYDMKSLKLEKDKEEKIIQIGA